MILHVELVVSFKDYCVLINFHVTNHASTLHCMFINPWNVHFLLTGKNNPLEFNPDVLKKAAFQKALKVNYFL